MSGFDQTNHDPTFPRSVANAATRDAHWQVVLSTEHVCTICAACHCGAIVGQKIYFGDFRA